MRVLLFRVFFVIPVYSFFKGPLTRGGEGVRRNALRVLRPKSPHSEEIAQYIEWRDPCGHAAVWLKGSAVQGRHDRLIGKCWKVDTYSKREVIDIQHFPLVVFLV